MSRWNMTTGGKEKANPGVIVSDGMASLHYLV